MKLGTRSAVYSDAVLSPELRVMLLRTGHKYKSCAYMAQCDTHKIHDTTASTTLGPRLLLPSVFGSYLDFS